ncbi:MAG: TolC family protein [Bacteroidales bacterium]|jgi:outer membrane protein TolC|nr:TolC family protein [Bacteroidales bacterium]
MRKIIIITSITSLILAFLCLRASAQDTAIYLSVSGACQLAIEKNVEVRNSEWEQKKRKFQLSEAQSKLYPHLEGFTSLSNNFLIPKMIVPGEIFGQTGLIPVEIGTRFDWISGFKASQILYNQSYFTSLKLLKQFENLGSISLIQQKEEIVYQVSQLYYLCKCTGKQLEHLSINLTNIDRLAEITRLRSDNGLARKADYASVLVNKANVQTQIDNLRQLQRQQLGLLSFLIGLDMNSRIVLTDSLNSGNLKTSDDSLFLNNRSSILMLEKQIEITNLSRKRKQQEYLPSLAATAQYYFQGQRNDFDFLKGGEDKFYKVGFAGLILNIPIFNGFEKRSSKAQYEIELIQLKNTMENTRKYLSKEYSDALAQYKNSINIIWRQEENIKTAEEGYTMCVNGYVRQVIPLTDLILAETNLIEARLSLLNALLQFKNAELDLRKAKGELLEF